VNDLGGVASVGEASGAGVQSTGISGQSTNGARGESTNEASTHSPMPNANDLHLADIGGYRGEDAEVMISALGDVSNSAGELGAGDEFGITDESLQNMVGVVGSLNKGKGAGLGFDYDLLRWLVSLLILIAGASIAVIIIRDEEEADLLSPNEDIRKLAEEIEIIESKIKSE